MASLTGLTKRLAVGTGRLAAGTASNVYANVKGAVVSSTGINALRPTNIAAAILEKSGLGPFVPSLAGAFRGGESVGRATGGTTPSVPRTGAPAPQQAPFNDNQTQQTSILTKILNVDTTILEIAQKDTRNLESLTGYMKDLLGFMRGDAARRQEEAREARAQRAVPANDNTKQGPAKTTAGAGIMGLLSLIPGFNLVKSILSGITDAFNTIVKFGGILLRGLLGIGRFLIRFAGPVGAVIGVLLALESQDWEAFFGRFTSAFKDFMEGRWIEGIVKVVVAIPELLVKGVGRIIARVAEFFGFEAFAKALDEVIDNFDLVAILTTMFNYVKDTFISIKDTVVNFFTDAKNKIAEWWSSFSIIEPIVDTFNYVKEGVINTFTAVKDKIAEWFESASNLGSQIGETLGGAVSKVWEFFKSLPGKMVDAASNLVPDFIKEPFRKLFGTSETPAATAPTTQAAPVTRTATPTANTAAPVHATTTTPTAPPETPAVRSTTPVMPSKDIEVVKYAGKSKEQILEEILPYTGGDVGQAMAEAERIYAKVSKVPAAATSTTPPVQPVLSQREDVFNAQSSRQAIEQGTTPTQPVIINNTTTPSAPPSMTGGSTNNRMGGAVSTSPRDSHMDRALYGNYYGAGVP